VPWVVLPFASANALWIAGGATTAVLGLMERGTPRIETDPNWHPNSQTAILITVCGEDPAPLAQYLKGFSRAIDGSPLRSATRVFVLSDTFGADDIIAEEAALAHLIETDRISYRRRSENTGKKPGNIAQWLGEHGTDFDFMMVLDADSRMTVSRVTKMIGQLETKPHVGLLQAGIALVPGQSRFGCHQRNASRLLTRNFGRGFAAWTGETGTYWGHNAIMRVAAFRAAATLPTLSGPAPFGGPMISHDFIEAAWICRAGWSVELDPDAAGSAEDAPQTFQDFFKRDRRWCQGNLQHLRVLAEPGLHPISRLHLMLGIFSYLAAPIWLFFLALVSLKALAIAGLLPFVLVGITLLVPKFCALADAMLRARTPWRRSVIRRAWLSELALSTLLAPVIMMRQTVSIGSVLMGRDCGWKSGRKARIEPVLGLFEALIGLAVLGLSLMFTSIDTLWLSPIILSLISAPFVMRNMEAQK
jgi:membrane glycosyltransferase